MTSRRDYIEEIVLKHSRLSKRRGIHKLCHDRIHMVVAGYTFLREAELPDSVRLELIKYAPIGYVACLEGYLRLCLKQLIDSGDPYIDRVSEIEALRFDCRTVLAMTKDKISLGQYVSHVVPLNNVKDISSVFSVILAEDFLTAVKSINYMINEDGTRFALRTPMFDAEDYQALEELFRLRHIFAHELAPREKVKPNVIRDCISAAAAFVTACETLFRTKIPDMS